MCISFEWCQRVWNTFFNLRFQKTYNFNESCRRSGWPRYNNYSRFPKLGSFNKFMNKVWTHFAFEYSSSPSRAKHLSFPSDFWISCTCASTSALDYIVYWALAPYVYSARSLCHHWVLFNGGQQSSLTLLSITMFLWQSPSLDQNFVT